MADGGSRLGAFSRLSAWLTGEAALPGDLVRVHLRRLTREPDLMEALEALLARFEVVAQRADLDDEVLRREIVANPEFGPLARRIAILWFTGALPKNGWEQVTEKPERELDYDDGDPRPYFGALMWRAMGAHPPAISGGYFGYWRYSPEN